MINFDEVGYTPTNLRTLIKSSGLSQKAFAEKYDIAFRALQTYITVLDMPDHRDMSCKNWLELLKKVDKNS